MARNPRPPKKFDRRPPPDAHRINDRIQVPQVRLISETGEQLGVLATREAIRIAEERNLDLVEVAATAKPPVCKLMDYGKFKYKEQKKEAEARKKRSETTIKELRLRYNTDTGDLDIKLKKAREFLGDGDKVKFSMRFRGREIVYQEAGFEKLKLIAEQLSDVSEIDDQSPTGGRQIHMVLAPAKKSAAKQ
ncbi:MAG: translation initiation factor IF-3 [Bdellovibrionales bacterium]|nr:translation initiation factor IF-3 [Bdellovibrionales bacterium]